MKDDGARQASHGGRPPRSRWDEDLGRELRESPLPPHRTDYFEGIREHVRQLTGPDGLPPAPVGRAGSGRAKPRHSRGVRFALLTAAAAAVAAAVVLSWAGVPGVKRSAPSPATAHTVLA